MDQMKEGFKFFKLVSAQRHHLLSRLFEKIEYVQKIDICMPFHEYLLPKEQYFGIIICTQIGEFSDPSRSDRENSGCFRLLNKQIGLQPERSFAEETDRISG